DGDDAEADVVGAPLGLEAQAEGRPAGPAVVGPAPAPAHPRRAAGAVPLRRRPGVVQVGALAARQSCMIPVPAPLEDIAVHVVQAPGVGRVTADLRGTLQRRPLLGAVVRLALEVGLLAAEGIAESGGGGGAGAAGVLPLRLRGQAELPPLGQLAR